MNRQMVLNMSAADITFSLGVIGGLEYPSKVSELASREEMGRSVT